jgi:hypothetical protein
MTVNLRAKLNEFKVNPTSSSVDIMLPTAFIAKTLKKCGGIAEGVEVIVERNCFGQYDLTWYDAADRPVRGRANEGDGIIDLSSIYDLARQELLAAISSEDLQGEITRRKREAADAA